MIVLMMPLVPPALAEKTRKSSRNRENMQGQPVLVKFPVVRCEVFAMTGFFAVLGSRFPTSVAIHVAAKPMAARNTG
jgi:hypothetical protein